MTAPHWTPIVRDKATFNAAMQRARDDTNALIQYTRDLMLTRAIGLQPCAHGQHDDGCGCVL
ncbi:hypothetical protein [Aeromicrobium sp.]|uniref:hypothetical protein n=1 Tax=Aeromicrobium sp. TaxID=1871063 RepID=UPI002FC8552C